MTELNRAIRTAAATESTNLAMMALLSKLGYQQAGYVDHLNSDGSRELVFMRDLAG